MLHHEVVDEALIVGAVLLHVFVTVRLAEHLLEEVATHGDDHAWLGTMICPLEDLKHWVEQVATLQPLEVALVLTAQQAFVEFNYLYIEQL